MVKEVRVFAPATIGNFGPGFDVLGLAVSGLGDTFTARESDSFQIKVQGRDAGLIPLEPAKNSVTIAAQELARLVGKSIAFSLTIDRKLPASGGLGASASSAVAGAMIAAKFLDCPERQDLILEAALHAEAFVAGRHLDNIAPCILGGLTISQSVEPIQIFRAPTQGDYFIVLITPQLKINTAEARKVLPAQLSQGEWTKELAHTSTLLAGLATNNPEMIAQGLSSCYGERYRKGLIPGFDQAKAQLLENGAIAFTISGAGPSCFGLFLEKPDMDKIREISEQTLGEGTTVHLGSIEDKGAYYL